MFSVLWLAKNKGTESWPFSEEILFILWGISHLIKFRKSDFTEFYLLNIETWAYDNTYENNSQNNNKM